MDAAKYADGRRYQEIPSGRGSARDFRGHGSEPVRQQNEQKDRNIEILDRGSQKHHGSAATSRSASETNRVRKQLPELQTSDSSDESSGKDSQITSNSANMLGILSQQFSEPRSPTEPPPPPEPPPSPQSSPGVSSTSVERILTRRWERRFSSGRLQRLHNPSPDNPKFSHPRSADDVVSMNFELQDFSGMPDLIPDHAVASETAALVARNAYCDVMGCIAGAEIMIDNCLIMRRTEQHRSLRKLCSNPQLGLAALSALPLHVLRAHAKSVGVLGAVGGRVRRSKQGGYGARNFDQSW